MRSKYRRGKSESRTPALTLDMNDTTFPKEHKIPCDTAEDNDEQVEYTVHPQTRLEWQCKYNHQNKTQILYKAQPSESGQKQASSSSARSHAPKDGAPARRSPGPDLASVDLACIEALVGCEGKRLESLSCARAEAVRSKISRREAAAAARSRSHHLSSFFVRDNKNRLSISSIHLLQRLPPNQTKSIHHFHTPTYSKKWPTAAVKITSTRPSTRPRSSLARRYDTHIHCAMFEWTMTDISFFLDSRATPSTRQSTGSRTRRSRTSCARCLRRLRARR